ncbi:hypothetical protein [Flavobacterium sp. W20_MBD1_R3]|uniref:hypothetical protein n=1 Tax=Flavobacterium sp. W20_MBD1_R3 TaxID=3240278 RepID=UPI003F92B940
MEKKKSIKILSALSLASSDTREETLRTIIINTLFEKNGILQNNIEAEIKDSFGFEPYSSELSEILTTMIETNLIKLEDGILLLSDEERYRVSLLDAEIKDKEKIRFQNFKNFITDELEIVIEISKIKFLYSVFVEYLYHSFYEFGEETLNYFSPKPREIDLTNDDYLQQSFHKLGDKTLCSILKTVIDKYPENIPKEDLEFLNELALKTQSFASLGFSPDQSQDVIDLNLIEWVLYLDTNVLYSLLNLHSHPENEACRALIQLILDNNAHIKIVLRYSDLSLTELVNKKDDFKHLDKSITDSAIRGLLASDKLDEFSRQFYTNLLYNRNLTLHPSKVIDLATATLKVKKIEVSRTSKRLEKIGVEYVNIRVQEYLRFVGQKNDIRNEYGKKKGVNLRSVFRSDKQADHDISLREIIISQRSASTRNQEHLTFNNIKYYAVTLDNLLIQYDQQERVGHTDIRSFPVFFKPSFLLSKLIKILPIKTDDYKKAYFKALTARGFNKDTKRSEDIINIVNYLKHQGIDNEEIINNLISEDLFLEKYKEESKSNPSFDSGMFIEGVLNKQFAEKQEELNKAKDELSKIKTDALNVTSENSVLLKQINEKVVVTQIYDNAIKELNKKVTKLEKTRVVSNTQLDISFETEKDEKIKKLQTQLDYERIKTMEKETNLAIEKILKKWQFDSLRPLLITIPLLMGSFILVNVFKTEIEKSKLDLSILIPVLVGSINIFVFGFIFIRFCNDSNIEAKRKSIERQILENK